MRRAILGLAASAAALLSATPALAVNIIGVTINWAAAPVETFKIDLDAGFLSATGGGQFLIYNLIDDSAGRQGIYFGSGGQIGTGSLYQSDGGLIVLDQVSDVLFTPVFSGAGLTASLVPGQSYNARGGSVLTVAPLASGVPEPTTWAMLLAGFGVVGCAMRRRQRQTVRYSFG